MFISAAAMERLTGYRRSSAQIRWLRRNGWRFSVNGLNAPVVAFAEFERKLVSAPGRTAHQEPNFEALNG